MPITAQVDVSVTRDATPHAPAGAARINSLDLWRGAVMVLMAIDHVRVYAGVPAGGLDAGVFFIRWVTHFCAPGFVFFAGRAQMFEGAADKPEHDVWTLVETASAQKAITEHLLKNRRRRG